MIRGAFKVALLLALAACSSSDDPTDLDEDETLGGSMSARIDGQAWTATSSSGGTAIQGTFGFAGTDAAGRTIVVVVSAVPQPGAQAIRTSTANNLAFTINDSNGAAWIATQANGNGELRIDSFTNTNASGSFTFDAVPVAGTSATGTKVVTNGVFNVRLFTQP
jgi:hypothetical protein